MESKKKKKNWVSNGKEGKNEDEKDCSRFIL